MAVAEVTAAEPDPADTDLEALDRLGQPAGTPAARLGRRALRTLTPPLVTAALVLAVWQSYVWISGTPGYLFPSPADTWHALTADWRPARVPLGVWNSTSRALAGFALSAAIGTPLGYLVGRIAVLRTAVLPFLVGLQSLPSVAAVPAAILWFGITPDTLTFVILLSAVPSVAVGLVAGLDQIPRLWLLAGRNLGAAGFGAARHVLLPAALPGYLAGLKQGWAFAWRSLMAAELIAVSPVLGPGLGAQLDQARQLSDLPGAFAATLLILAVGVTVNQAMFAPLERRVRRARGQLPN